LASRRLPVPPKVSQIDADDLDEALVGMLGERIERSLGNLRVGLRLDADYGSDTDRIGQSVI
jgi:peroxin-2